MSNEKVPGPSPDTRKFKRTPRSERSQENDVCAPALYSIEWHVWRICDKYRRRHHRAPLRSQAVPLAVAAGVNKHSARLFVGTWRRYHGYTPGSPEQC